ncbi:MAG TPA: energy transducer TonB [Nitrosomonas nitrosa]|uniref:Protein TonB n=1 Tax=Nitrosomonas nitrosa TaxID=52442 RepID=A0A1I4RIN0_9PROT|nr:energy transducer TonB [Nitrosomonas nitrosa]MCO6433597.1 energy transducer TonB [Nitrosomonas nitrosa]PTQ94473.1 outer membrane transport energization protein TonB [Nitrosomonas nitrosa]CAE6498703.1 Protein TonB [Nitrosomonas nitrosa]SFM52085.1 outer membrane transport energization protein TonB [Nitrosomonas nitrosa]HBZ30640.1 energy transducer TonB [Nitrosomonas nitrosa]
MKASKHVVALSSMLMGPVLVFGLVILMNKFAGQVDKAPVQEMTEISMVKQPPPEPKKIVKKIEPKKQPARTDAPPPFKGLSSSLSGIDLGLFGIDDGGMSGVDESLLGKTGNAVMTEDLVDVPPKPKSRSAFRYPPAAKKKGIKGYVVLSVLVDTDGSVKQIQVLESSPSGVFDDAALQGVRSWQFEPAKYKGDSVRVWAKQKIRFDLS